MSLPVVIGTPAMEHIYVFLPLSLSGMTDTMVD